MDKIYKICHKVIHDHKFVWFQYRVLFKILGTKEYLRKLKISETNECGLCKQAPETMVHLFTQCNKSNELWENIVKWIKNKIGIDIVLSNTHKILGYLTMDAKFWPIKNVYTEQYLLHCLNSFNNNFSRKWA